MLEAAVVEEAPKPKGLKVLKLLDPSVPHTELALILAHVRSLPPLPGFLFREPLTPGVRYLRVVRRSRH